MSKKCSVVLLCQDLCFGGTQRQMLELARRLNKDIFDVSIWTLSGETDLDSLAHEAGISVRHLGNSLFPSLRSLFALISCLRRESVSVLVPCTALPNIWGRVLGRLFRIPAIVGTCRGGGGPKRQHERALWRLTDHMICNSQALYDIFCGMGVPAQRLSFISNGVDTDWFMPGDEAYAQRKPLVVCVGRLVEDKDHMTLLRAFELVCQEIPDARLRLVGDGPEEQNIRAFVDASSLLRQAIVIHPGCTDVRPHYREAALFALSSVREGQPNVLLEAMASALPVVATDVGGIPGLVIHEETGMLSPAGDARMLASHMISLLGDPDKARRMGEAGRIRVQESFDFSVMVRAHEAVFLALAQR